MMCSLTLDFAEGFWSIRMGSTAAAFNAMLSMADPEANALYILPSSVTKLF